MFVSHFQRSMETAAIQGLLARFAHTAPGYLIPRRLRSKPEFFCKAAQRRLRLRRRGIPVTRLRAFPPPVVNFSHSPRLQPQFSCQIQRTNAARTLRS